MMILLRMLPLAFAVACGMICTTGAAQEASPPATTAPVDPYAADAAAKALRLSGAGICRVHFNGDGRVLNATMIRSTGSTVLDEDTLRSARRNWQGLADTTANIPVRYSTAPLDKGGTIQYQTPIPEYPSWAAHYFLAGRCVLQVLFNKSGSPDYVSVLKSCGNKPLDNFTVRYAQAHWKSSGGEESVLTYPVTYVYTATR